MLDCRKEINLMCEALEKGWKWRDKIDDIQSDERRWDHLATECNIEKKRKDRLLGPHNLEIKKGMQRKDWEGAPFEMCGHLMRMCLWVIFCLSQTTFAESFCLKSHVLESRDFLLFDYLFLLLSLFCQQRHSWDGC